MSNAQDQVKALVEKLDALRAEAVAMTKPDPMQEVAESLILRIRAEVLRELRATPLKVAQATRVEGRRKPRSWTPEQKVKILGEIEAARGKWGGVARVLDKHRIVSANVAQWRAQVSAK